MGIPSGDKYCHDIKPKIAAKEMAQLENMRLQAENY
jgi:hypothetical protein